MLKLKLQYFGHLMWRTDSLEKTLMLEKIEGRRKRGLQRMRCLESITDSTDMNLSKRWKIVKDKEAWHGVAKNWTWLSNWTEHSSPSIVVQQQVIISEFSQEKRITVLLCRLPCHTHEAVVCKIPRSFILVSTYSESYMCIHTCLFIVLNQWNFEEK